MINYNERINRKMKTIMLVFGTRSEAIKMCPLVNELKKREYQNGCMCYRSASRDAAAGTGCV